MKKVLLSAILMGFAVFASAQPQGGFGGFGGFQRPQIKLETSQEWKDVNYAGDDQAYHTCETHIKLRMPFVESWQSECGG